MRTLPLVAALLLAAPAYAKDVHRVAWDLSLDGRRVGTRQATVTFDQVDGVSTRMIEAVTEVDAQVGPVPVRWRQRLTVLGAEEPAAFHAVIRENGQPREVQARWTGTGWVVTLADRRGARTWDAAAHRIDLSTADLVDPGSNLRLAAFETAKVLSTETGDIWEGAVEPLGARTLTVGGRPVDVQGWAWTSPEGRSTFWYDANGWLVHYETHLAGHRLAGTLTEPPPQGPDTFAVEPETGPVQSVDL